MSRRKYTVGLLAAGMIAAGLIAPTSAYASATTLSMQLTQVVGGSPVGFAAYEVVYMQPSLSDGPVGTNVPLTVLASGNANLQGTFTATLNTSSIDPADLGDAVGGGAFVDAFNADVILQDDSGNQVLIPEILRLGQDTSDPESVGLQTSSSMTGAMNAAPFPNSVPILDSKYRWMPVTPLNVGDGMEAVLHYTYSTSEAKQTKATTAIISTAPGGGGWGVGAMQMEETNRNTHGQLKHDNDYHRWIWARYKWNLYAYRLNHKWLSHHWTGDMQENNTDAGGKHGTKNPIGIVKWDVPAFTPGPGGAYWFALTSANSGWGRDSGDRAANDASLSFYIPFGGDLVMDDLTTYGSITEVDYNYLANGMCPSGNTRVIWGHSNDPGVVKRLEANCFSNSMLN
jgi:hypothetical protein